MDKIPVYFKDKEPPVISYQYTNTVANKLLECCMDWFHSLICKNYIFKHFVRTVEVTSLKLHTILKLVTLHLEQTIAQVTMKITPMHMHRS